MSLEKQDYLSRLQRILQDVGEFLQPDDIEIFLIQAVLIYSKDRPQIKVYEITGDDSSFDFAVPSDWEENFSFIRGRIEYPVDDTVQSPQYLDQEDWMFLRKLSAGVTALYIRFLTFTPDSSEKARFEYTIKHTLNDSTNTIKDGDSEAVINLTAALCYWALASRFAQSSDPSIEADVIDYARKSEIYTDLAEKRMSLYKSLMGLGQEGKEKTAASAGVAISDLDMQYPGSIGDYLTHPTVIR